MTGTRAATLLAIGMGLSAMGGVLGDAGIVALFVHRVGVERLPAVYVLDALTTAAASLAWALVLARRPPARVVLRLWTLAPLSVLALALWAQTGAGTAPWALWAAGGACQAVQALILWGNAGTLFDVREARRVYPWLSAATVTGAALGGLAALTMGGQLGGVGLVFVRALLSLLVAAILAKLGGGVDEPADEGGGLASGLREALGSALVRRLAVAGVLFGALHLVLEYTFAAAVDSRFGEEAAMASFLGAMDGAVTVAALGVSLGVTPWFFRRFGVPEALFVQPALYAAGFGLLAFAPGFTAVAGLQATVGAWLGGATDPAYNAALHAAPGRYREHARAMVEGLALRAGVVLGAIALILGEEHLDPQLRSIATAGFGVVTLFVMQGVRRAYVGALGHGLSGLFGGRSAGSALPPAAARGLAEPRLARFVRLRGLAASVRPHASGDDRMELLAASLAAELDELAREIVAAACSGVPTEPVNEVLAGLDSEDPEERSRALELAGRLAWPPLFDPVLPHLEGRWPDAPGSLDAALTALQADPSPWLRACVAAGATPPAPAGSEVDRVRALRRMPLFSSLPVADLRRLAGVMDEHRFADGDVLAREGEQGDRVHIVLEGEISVLRGGLGAGAELARRGAGEPAGEMGVLTDAPRMASLRAVGRTRTLSMGRAHFRQAVRERPGIALAVIAALCDRLRES